MNPGFGSPSIDEINSITGYDSDLGSDDGKLGPYSGFWSSFIAGAEILIAQGRSALVKDFDAKSGTNNGIGGTWYSYSYYPNDGVDRGFGNESTLNTALLDAWFVPSQSKNSENVWEKANRINNAAGIIFGGVETFSNSTKVIEIAHDLGVAGAVAGTMGDAYGVYNYEKYGAYDKLHYIVSPVKFSVNASVAVYSLSTGPPGWIVGSIYFTIDATIGWDNALTSYVEVEKNKQTMRDYNIMTFSDFKY
jgi:hypothetical protein